MNYTQQSIANGNFGLEGKSLSSLGFSAFTPYSASVRGQMVIGASDPWLNLSYQNGIRFDGYFGGGSASPYNALVNSGIGAMRPYLGLSNGAGLTERILWGMMWESTLSGGQVLNNVVNP